MTDYVFWIIVRPVFYAVSCILRIFSKKRGGSEIPIQNTGIMATTWAYFPYLAAIKNGYPEILRRYHFALFFVHFGTPSQLA